MLIYMCFFTKDNLFEIRQIEYVLFDFSGISHSAFIISSSLILMVLYMIYLFYRDDLLTIIVRNFTMRTKQQTKCFEPLPKLRASLVSR